MPENEEIANEQVDAQDFNDAWNIASQDKPETPPEIPPETLTVITSQDGTDGTSAPPIIESEKTYEQRWKSLDGILRKKDEEKAQLQAKIDELSQKLNPPPPIITDTKKEDELELSPEEKAELEQYYQDFDVVAKMESLNRKIEAAKLKKELKGLVEPLQAQLQELIEWRNTALAGMEEEARTVHFNTVKEVHPDYETYHNDGSIQRWIDAQPTARKVGLEYVVEKGSAEDVIALLNEFKAENNISPSNVVNINSQRKDEKRLTMTPPVTKKGPVAPAMGVATNYEDAFDEALRKG